jgi:nitrite reductase (NO-forming)
MHTAGTFVLASIAALCAGCSSASGAAEAPSSHPLTGSGLPAIAGQAATCAAPRDRTFTLETRETRVDLGMGYAFEAWTYNGSLPGPVLEACEGDRVTITVTNHGEASHGLDSHAFRADMMQFGPVASGASMTIETRVDTPGVFMYHCAAGPVTDYHIKSGLHGAMIVYPRDQSLRPARELVVVQSGVFGEQGTDGVIPGTDPQRALKNDPSLMMFNGRLTHEPIPVQVGDLIRAYVVNIGPGTSAIHVMGTILEAVYDGASTMKDVQTYGVPAGGGAMVEFRIPEPGMYGLVDHDRLGFLQYGMVMPFHAVARPAVETR